MPKKISLVASLSRRSENILGALSAGSSLALENLGLQEKKTLDAAGR